MILININHPCYEVDVVELTDKDEIKIVKGQGYIELDDLRRIVDKEEEMRDWMIRYMTSR